MKELTAADLKPNGGLYESSRPLHDVLIGENTALPLIEASSSGNDTLLRSMLSQPKWSKIALEEPHWIDGEISPSQGGQVRDVTAKPTLTLDRAMMKAVENNHATVVSTLLDFALQHDVEVSSILRRWSVNMAVQSGYTDIVEAMASTYPEIVEYRLDPSNSRPLDKAVARRKTDMVAVLLRFGADPQPPTPSHKRADSYRASLLSQSVLVQGTRMTELLLEHGVSVSRSGALHLAAELGALDSMRLLIQHGADVNERLPEDTIWGPSGSKRSLFATWTPMHCAASHGQTDAMDLLKSIGARSDIQDINGDTPAQVLEKGR